jgi:hypothetical protein
MASCCYGSSSQSRPFCLSQSTSARRRNPNHEKGIRAGHGIHWRRRRVPLRTRLQGTAPGTHERYVEAQWRQTLGSTMHCAAGDGMGILAGAVLASTFHITGLSEIVLEYLLGFGRSVSATPEGSPIARAVPLERKASPGSAARHGPGNGEMRRSGCQP